MLKLSAVALLASTYLSPAIASEWTQDGNWKISKTQYQEGRLSFAVSCPKDCNIGARILTTDDQTYWISFSGDDFGSVYHQTLDATGDVTEQKKIAESRQKSPFPSPEPVFIEVGVQGDRVTAFAGGSRLWWPSVDVSETAPNAGTFDIFSKGAKISQANVEDRLVRKMPSPKTGDGFTVQQISDLFYGETVSVGDINNDGVSDIVAGPHYFLGPDFATRGEIYSEEPTTPNSYSSGMLSLVDDLDGDGWDDVLILESGRESGAHAGMLYINPQGASRLWDRHTVIPTTQGEASAWGDIDGDDSNELLLIREGTVGIASPGANPTATWNYRPISQEVEGRLNPHGLGIGDVDSDGREDILHASGWWQQPENWDDEWTYTPYPFGNGAQIHVADLTGDGRSDVISAWDAHGWGLNWFSQGEDGSFDKHLIMGDPSQTPASQKLTPFSEPHAVQFTDINGDGLQDIVTGKRWWAHRDTYMDPDGQGAPVLYAFLQQRSRNGKVSFQPHFIGNHVGVGNQIAVEDLNGDGKPEIISSARKGTYIYWNNMTSDKKR